MSKFAGQVEQGQSGESAGNSRAPRAQRRPSSLTIELNRGNAKNSGSIDENPVLLVPVELTGSMRVHGMIPLRNIDFFALSTKLGGEVTLPTVVYHGCDALQARPLARQFQSGRHVRAGRDPAEDPLFLRQPTGHDQCFLAGGGHYSGELGEIEHPWNETISDSFDAMRAPLPSRQQGALRRLDRKELHPRIPLSQVSTDAGECPSGTLGGDVSVHLSTHLFPDLGTGAAIVRLYIIGIVELRRHPILFRGALADLLQLPQSEIHVALAAGRENKLRPVGAVHFLTFFTHALRHDDDAVVSLHRGDKGAGDSRVTGRALQKGHARSKLAALLGFLDHRPVDAVLQTSGRTVVL